MIIRNLVLGLDLGFGYLKAISEDGAVLLPATYQKGTIVDGNSVGIEVNVENENYIAGIGDNYIANMREKVVDKSTIILTLAAIKQFYNGADVVEVTIAAGLPARQYAALRDDLIKTLSSINELNVKFDGKKVKVVIKKVYTSRQGNVITALEQIGADSGSTLCIDIGTKTVNAISMEDGLIENPEKDILTLSAGIQNLYTSFGQTLSNDFFIDENGKEVNLNIKGNKDVRKIITNGYVVARGKKYYLTQPGHYTELLNKDIEKEFLSHLNIIKETFDVQKYEHIVVFGGGANQFVKNYIKKVLESDVVVDEFRVIHGYDINKKKFNLEKEEFSINQFLNAINYYLLAKDA